MLLVYFVVKFSTKKNKHRHQATIIQNSLLFTKVSTRVRERQGFVGK